MNNSEKMLEKNIIGEPSEGKGRIEEYVKDGKWCINIYVNGKKVLTNE